MPQTAGIVQAELLQTGVPFELLSKMGLIRGKGAVREREPTRMVLGWETGIESHPQRKFKHLQGSG